MNSRLLFLLYVLIAVIIYTGIRNEMEYRIREIDEHISQEVGNLYGSIQVNTDLINSVYKTCKK